MPTTPFNSKWGKQNDQVLHLKEVLMEGLPFKGHELKRRVT